MEVNEDLMFHNYLLNDWGVGEDNQHPCDLCELCEECDRLADDLNNIEYCMCLSRGVIKDIQYKKDHPNAFFKKID